MAFKVSPEKQRLLTVTIDKEANTDESQTFCEKDLRKMQDY